MYKLTENAKTAIRKIVLNSSEIISENGTDAFDETSIKQKGFADYVTKIDEDIQTYVEKHIFQLFPEHQFLGEEGARNNFDYDKACWILDPIDGTTNLILDARHSCISLAYWNGIELSYALIYDPFLDELFEANKGGGAYLIESAKEKNMEATKQKLEMNQMINLKQAIVAFGTAPHDRNTEIDHRVLFEVLSDVFMATEDIRRFGSAALDMAYLAANRFHIFFEPKLRPWDFAAGILIIEEAGGRVTDINNQNIDIFQAGSILAANPRLHQEFLPLLNKLK